MRSVMNAQQMRAVDNYMIKKLHIPGVVLMENAAMGTARLVMEKKPDPCVVHVFCGTGNNGGDGLACARILLARGYDAYVVLVGSPEQLTGDAKTNYAMFEEFPDRVLSVSSIEDLYSWRVPKAEVIVDALFGIGLTRDVLGVHAEVIASMNSVQALRVSVDIPSGIDADTGRIMGTAVRADCTATFQYPKVGHFLYPGREYTGELRIVTIGIDKGVEDEVDSRMCVYESDDPDILVPKRNPDTNKGTYGKLLVVAGSRGMAGAAVMCAKAAYASGTGLVTVAAPWAVIDVMQNAVPEATCQLMPEEEGRIYSGSTDAILQASTGKTAVAVGPGLGSGKGLKTVISDMLTTYDVCRVVDADALNALDKDLKVLAHVRGDVVFTPHPMEFARLLGTDVSSVKEHPLELATAFAQKCRVTLVLKGATTIIAGPSGDVTFIAAGSPGMAKAGSGDVLTGTIAGLAAQGLSGYEAAVMGVYLCSMAGEASAKIHGEYSSSPNDTIECLGKCIKDCISDEVPAWHLPAGAGSSGTSSSGSASAAQHAAAPAKHAGVQTSGDMERPPDSSAAKERHVSQSLENKNDAATAAAVASAADSIRADAASKPEIKDQPAARAGISSVPGPQENSSMGSLHTAGVDSLLHEEKARTDEARTVEVDLDGPERVRNSSRSTSTGSPVVPAAAEPTPERARPENADRAHGQHSHQKHGQAGHGRMSARDIRPPRIPVQSSQSQSSTGDTTKVVESLQDKLSSAAKDAPTHTESTRQQKRAEKRRQDKQQPQTQPQVSSVEPAPPVPTEEESAEARKRERLNQEIQKELNGKKTQGRTRRRIG